MAIAAALAFFAPAEHGVRRNIKIPRAPRGRRKWSGSHDQERARRRRQIERGTLKVAP